MTFAAQLGIIFGVLYAVHGYQAVFNHNKNQSWMSQNGGGYQYTYRPQSSIKWQMSDQNWRMTNTMSTPQWRDPLSKPQWQNDMSKPKWQNPMSKPQWRTIMSKPKWRDSLSKPQWNSVKPRYMPKPQWNKPVLRTTTLSSSAPPAKPAFDFASREWPEYIPPITMIKPRMDPPF